MNAGSSTSWRAHLLAGVAGIAMGLCSLQPKVVAAATDEALVQDLLKKLEERDSKIDDLLKRVQQLEQRLDGAAPAAQAAAAPAAAGDTAARGPTAQAEVPAGAPQPTPSGAASPPRSPGAPPPTPAAGDTAAPAAPGTFEVDPEAAERALERTLTQAGALLLPFGAVDVEPGFTYIRRETTRPVFQQEVEGLITVATEDTREDDLTGSLDFRFGLPWTSQFELSIPYTYKEESVVIPNTEESTSASGFGDVSVGLAKELLRERGWRPDLLARVTWDADTGREKDGLELGGGFHSITGSLTALKRQDPLAFFASGFYSTSFEKDDVEPGDEFGFTIGTVLAASPETSLSLSLQQTFSKELKLGGSSLPGSDQNSSILVVGASSVLGRSVLLSVNAGVGLTDDAPDYFVGISLPIRFNLPIR